MAVGRDRYMYIGRVYMSSGPMCLCCLSTVVVPVLLYAPCMVAPQSLSTPLKNSLPLVMQALLMYLDAESHKIVGEYTPTTSGFNPSTPTRTGRTRQYNRVHSRPGQGLFSAVQGLLGGAAGGIAGVLGGRGGAQQEMPQPSGDSSDSASPDIKAQELARQELDRFWGEMRRIWWCPVLQDSPEEGLPWPEHSSRGNRGLLSAPRGARPMQDMWLASSVMDIVDGECR